MIDLIWYLIVVCLALLVLGRIITLITLSYEEKSRHDEIVGEIDEIKALLAAKARLAADAPGEVDKEAET